MAKNALLLSLKKLGIFAWDLLCGKIVSVKFMKAHFPILALVLLVFMGYISNKFSSQLEMRRINKLEAQLEVSQTRFINASSSYFSKIREKTMRQMADTAGLGLKVSEEPPFQIGKK